ncbi:hypothetical protein V6N13_123805 [Hibiscus sabdariffa]
MAVPFLFCTLALLLSAPRLEHIFPCSNITASPQSVPGDHLSNPLPVSDSTLHDIPTGSSSSSQPGNITPTTNTTTNDNTVDATLHDGHGVGLPTTNDDDASNAPTDDANDDADDANDGHGDAPNADDDNTIASSSSTISSDNADLPTTSIDLPMTNDNLWQNSMPFELMKLGI